MFSIFVIRIFFLFKTNSYLISFYFVYKNLTDLIIGIISSKLDFYSILVFCKVKKKNQIPKRRGDKELAENLCLKSRIINSFTSEKYTILKKDQFYFKTTLIVKCIKVFNIFS